MPLFDFYKPKINKYMKIKILNKVKIGGKETPLLNYQYIAEDGTPISAIFQATKNAIPTL